MKLFIVIPGKPQGKARARTCKTGHSYTPENTVLYENLIKTSFLERYGAVSYTHLVRVFVLVNADTPFLLRWYI